LLQSLDKMKSKKGALEISFGWLFAIVAGIVIIFIAIYISSRLIGTQQTSISAQTGKQIGILLDPLETGFESAQTTSITIPSDTRINNICDSAGTFGKQIINLEQKSFGKWIKTDVNVGFQNKYIFSDGQIEGKKFYVFSKPFSFPFKIADLMYITSSDKRYCFSNAPNEINQEISTLNQSNLVVDNCAVNDVKICFGKENCEINVDFSSNSVEKNGTKVYFAGDDRTLMYAAIFSNKTIYECQIKRLMSRVGEISSLYASKELLINGKGCQNDIGSNLGELSGLANELNKSNELEIVKIEADMINQKNNAGVCQLW